VYFGGPVEMYRGFCLHSSDYKNDESIEIDKNIYLTANKSIILDIAKSGGPEDMLFLLGYSGWAPGQLEYEISANGWLVVPSDEKVIFKTPDELKWKMAAMNHGIDITIMGGQAGTA
ncbi:MAG: YqgE/AlgH family protein, partial [Nitrospirae bacterium]